MDELKKTFITNLGLYAICVFCLLPVLIWWPDANFTTFPKSLRSLGQASGLVGATLFAINFILGARLGFLERFFNGLNRIYINHHTLGALAFILLLFHPLFLALWYVPASVLVASELLIPTLANLPVWFGVMSLITMIILLVITLYTHLPYNIWKITHKILGLPLFLATLHILFIPSTTSFNLPLRIYMLAWVTSGFAAYTYRVLLGWLLVKKWPYVVVSVKNLPGNITEVSLHPLSRPLRFQPGQFIFFDTVSPRISRETHPFSISSAPSAEELKISAKSLGDYTETLKFLKVSSRVKIEGPFGRFSYLNSPNRKQIWVAGGIGLTPFLSMARSLAPENAYGIDFYYCVSTPDEAAYLDEFQAISTKIPGFKIFPVFTRTHGRLTATSMSQTTPDLASRDIFLCGPPPLMQGLRQQLRATGIKNSHIYSEEFSLE